MTEPKRTPEGGTGLEAISGLLNLFGKDQRVTGTADTGALKDLLARITAPQDANAQLEGLFQTAAGQIPKFQAAFGNAVGARSGGNSAVNAALQNLLQQTTLAGQKQIAEQQLQRDQIAANAAGSLASATRSTTTKERPNLSGAGKALGILQLGSKLGLTDKLKQGVLGTGLASSGAGAETSIFGADTPSFLPNFSATPFLADAGGGGIDLSSAFSATPFDFSLADAGGEAFSFGSDLYSGAADAVGGVADSAGDFFGDIGSGIKEFFGFADGGLIGRDGEPVGKFTMVDEAAGYADGGVVKAGGGRRSSAPTYTPMVRPTTSAVNTVEGQFGLPAQRQRLDQDLIDLVEADLGTGEGGTVSPNQAVAAPNDAAAVVNGMIGLGAIAAMSGIPGLSALGSTLGLTQSLSQSLSSLTAGLTGAASAGVAGSGTVGDESDSAVGPGVGIGAPGAGTAAGDLAGNTEGSGGQVGGSGDGGPGPGGDSSNSPGSGEGNSAFAHGGQIRGPGTPTSDSVPIMASVNEYVVSADVVDALGVEFFDNLQKNFHTMAGVQKLPAPKHLQTMKR